MNLLPRGEVPKTNKTMNTDEIVEKARKELAKEKSGAIWLAMMGLSEYIVFSAIAKNYFKKSANWILQRLHGYEVNGKPAQFKPDETAIFVQALRDLSSKLEEAAAQIEKAQDTQQ